MRKLLSSLLCCILTAPLLGQTHEWTNFAGLPGYDGVADGIGGMALFDAPRGIAVAADGTVYVAEEDNEAIRKITPQGVVSLLAGWIGSSGGFQDGTGNAARFYDASDLAIGPDGNIYLADALNNRIRKVTPAGVVTTFAGGGSSSLVNGPRLTARFSRPMGLAFDTTGNLYVADTGNDVIRKIDTNGDVTTLAGNPSFSGYLNGNGGNARFDYPKSVAVGLDGNIYVADSDNHTIRKVTPGGDVTTFAGDYYDDGIYPTPPTHVDGTGTDARFYYPADLAVDADGNLLVADTRNNVIRKITVDAVVTTLAGDPDSSGISVGTDSNVRFSSPYSVALAPDGTLYVADTSNNRIAKRALVQTGITASGKGVDILNGSAPAMLADDTDFGVVNTNGGKKEHTFTITNTGTETINLTGTPRVRIEGFHKDDYTVTAQPAATVAGGDSLTFKVTFDPSNQGLRRGQVVIESDAPNHSLFHFLLIGEGNGVPPPDKTKPTVTILTPKKNGTVFSSPLDVTGITSDNADVTGVYVELDSEFIGSYAQRTLVEPKTYSFKRTITLPAPGKYKISVTSYDPEDNYTTVTHSFTYDPRNTLSITRIVPEAVGETPDLAGTLALKASPTKNAAVAETGISQAWGITQGTPVTLTATAKKGYLFSQWAGLPGGAEINGNVASFTMGSSDLSGITATFVANPFLPIASAPSTPPVIDWGSAPVLMGVIQPASDQSATNTSVAYITTNVVAAKASLSGKIQYDGQLTAFKGILQGNGSILFKVGKVTSPELPLKGNGTAVKKISLATWNSTGMVFTLQPDAASPGQVIAGTVFPATYHKKNLIPSELDLLNASKGRSGYFTLSLPPRALASTSPKGSGYATLTLANAGTLKIAGVLADGSKITASSFLVEDNRAIIFIPLTTPGGRTKDGSLLGDLAFTASDSFDVTSPGWRWIRPAALGTKITLYPAGWPNGIWLDPEGAHYDSATPVQDALGLSEADPVNGNAWLYFQDGKLDDGDNSVSASPFNIVVSKFIKIVGHPPCTLVLTSKTGLFKGTFTPVWADPANLDKKLPAFQGILLQKDIRRGSGFFISNQKNDPAPESGRATLSNFP